MTYKPELLVTAGQVEDVTKLIEAGASAILVGESKFGSRLTGEFTLDMIAKVIDDVHKLGAKLYVSMNNMMDNKTVAELPSYLQRLVELNVDAVVYGDPSVLMAARVHAPGLKLHWNAEMTSTNYKTAEYWAKRGTSRYVTARELNMDEIIDTKEKSSIELEVQVHGMTAIYHSKRHLLSSYENYQLDKSELKTLAEGKNLFIMENERPDERFPIYEDQYGTHVMSSDDICMLENLNELLAVKVDSFKIEGIFKTLEYNIAVVKAYRTVIDAYLANPDEYKFEEAWLDDIRELQDPHRELSFGFFFKEQVY